MGCRQLCHYRTRRRPRTGPTRTGRPRCPPARASPLLGRVCWDMATSRRSRSTGLLRHSGRRRRWRPRVDSDGSRVSCPTGSRHWPSRCRRQRTLRRKPQAGGGQRDERELSSRVSWTSRAGDHRIRRRGAPDPVSRDHRCDPSAGAAQAVTTSPWWEPVVLVGASGSSTGGHRYVSKQHGRADCGYIP